MRRLLALLLCLMLLPCAALAADDTVLVVIEEGSGFTVAENGLRVLPGLLCLFVNQKGMLLPAIHSGSMAMACPLPRADTKMLSFIIHFRPDETRFVTKFGRYFHVLFTFLS